MAKVSLEILSEVLPILGNGLIEAFSLMAPHSLQSGVILVLRILEAIIFLPRCLLMAAAGVTAYLLSTLVVSLNRRLIQEEFRTPPSSPHLAIGPHVVLHLQAQVCNLFLLFHHHNCYHPCSSNL